MNHSLAKGSVLCLSILSLLTLVFVNQPSYAATYPIDNGTISVTFNDERFPLDDFDFPINTTHLHNLYVGIYDGTDGHYFNNGLIHGDNSPLMLVGDIIVSGAGDEQSVTITFADQSLPQRFTLELVFEMLGTGTRAIRGTATVTNLQAQALKNVKLYIFSDLAVSAGDSSDVTAFDSERGIFYAYDTTNLPHTYFGIHTTGAYPLFYEAHPYQGPVGLSPFFTAMALGDNLTNLVDGTPQDAVAGWNWHIGTISTLSTLSFSIGAGANLPDLISSLEEALPSSLLFEDGFEGGATSEWFTTVP